MGIDISTMRHSIMHVPKYNSIGWHLKVRSMPDNQVIAIYKKFMSDGLFDKRKNRKARKKDENYHQITMFEYLETIDKKE